MRILRGLLLCALCPAAARAEPPRTLLLLVEGRPGGVSVTAAWRRGFPFATRHRAAGARDRIRLLDAAGRLLAEVPIDFGAIDFETGRTVVRGDRVHEGPVTLLAKVPDLGRRLARLEIERSQGGRTRRLGAISGDRLQALLAAPPHALGGPVVRTHQKNGPVANRYDIVILGDGYRAQEQLQFYVDVTRWMYDLFAREPYKTYRRFFNVHSVFRASKQSGADQPDRNPPIWRDTAYDASYNTGNTPRCLYIKNQSLASRDAALAPDVEGRVVVFVNDARYGGCAGTFAVSYNGSLGLEVQSHEFGHSFGGLADEYGGKGTYTGPEPAQPNVTADKGCRKWALWKGYNGVGCFEGGRYYNRGIWRPKVDCLMRSLLRPLCEVCVEQLAKRCYGVVDPIENPEPPAGTVTLTRPAAGTFRFADLVPGGGRIRWYLDDSLAGSGKTSFVLASTKVAAGRHGLRLELADPSALVRKDPSKRLVHARTWTVDIIDSSLPELDVASFVAPKNARSGTSITVDVQVRNTGPTAAGSFRVEHFLSTDAVPTTDDVYLGFQTVPSLAARASTRVRRSVRLPYFLDRRSYRVATWVDRLGQIPENNKANNVALAPITVLGPTGCVTRLEFRKPLRYPPEQDSISLSAGGVSPLALTSPCLANHYYLVLWGCSGTAPGTRLGAFTLPLNLDACTTFSLLATNGPFFGFFGKIPLFGHALATVAIPKNTAVPPFTSHFAALFLAPDLRRVTGVTNSVRQTYVR